jgi:hypothetical protein
MTASAIWSAPPTAANGGALAFGRVAGATMFISNCQLRKSQSGGVAAALQMALGF